MKQDFFNSIKLAFEAPLDSDFKPSIIVQRKYEALCEELGYEYIYIALKRSDLQVCRFDLKLIKNEEYDELSKEYLLKTVKFLLWSIGGYELSVSGPQKWFNVLSQSFSKEGSYSFDYLFMERVYEKPFVVSSCEKNKLPKASEKNNSVGGHLKGYRIGFDLGASDYKIAAVKDGEVLFSQEIRWDPVPQKDSNYHWQRIVEGIKIAASHLPKVDAIGGSSAGIINDNKIMVASLFRSIPEEKFSTEITPLFTKLQKEWNVPLVAVNDGDVSALAGSLGTDETGILGIAMGSSEAVGFLNKKGQITGQLNELAFAPIDYNSKAAEDEWSKAVGVGVMYFSQQAVNHLAIKLGMSFPDEMLLPERLKVVQEKMNNGDEEVKKIYETIGVYLGYTLPYYTQFYDVNKLMAFGRVMSGKGGDVIMDVAQKVLRTEFPEVMERVQLAIPDEKFRRVGQAVAAASLPQAEV